MSSVPKRARDSGELYAEHSRLLQSGVLNMRTRAETNTGMSMFNEDITSLVTLPKPRRRHAATVSGRRLSNASQVVEDDEFQSLQTRAFAAVDGQGGFGYATRSAMDIAVPAALFFVLGFAPFAVINGLWAQIVVFRNAAPEGNAIGTRIGSVYNAANIFPFIYVAINKVCPIQDRIIIPCLVVLGVGVAVCLGMFWRETAELFGMELSYIIYIFSFLAGGVGCTLGVVLYSYVGRFRPFATTALSFGMGICGTAITGLGVLQRLGLTDCPRNLYEVQQYEHKFNITHSTSLGATTYPSHAPMTGTWEAAPVILHDCAVLMNKTLAGDQYSEHPQILHFDTFIFFSICAGLLLLSLGAFFIIDCCTGYMAPHEDPDFFFRDFDKTQAEKEEEERQQKRLSMETPEDEASLVGADGKVRFSLTINEDLETELEKDTPLEDDAPQVVMSEQAQAKLNSNRLWAASVMPCLDQFTKAFLVYFIAPGLGAYLTNDDDVVAMIMFVASAGNMVGRISTGFVTIWKLWLLNLICLALFAYEVMIAVWRGTPPFSPWWLVPIVALSSLLSGYVSTQVYMSANRSCIKHFDGDTTHAKDIRRYVSLANQLGMLVGTYGCLLASSLHAFSK